MKWTYAATGDIHIAGMSVGLGVNIAYLMSSFANTQCEAVRDRIRRYSVFEHKVGVCGHGGHVCRKYLGGPGVNIVYLRSHCANTQCEEVWDRI